jgi:homoserine O-acetyltransferase/O-succinyltransferase
LIHPPLAAWHIDASHQEASLGDLALENGETIRDFRQAYVTHGTLAADRRNAILACTALTGTHHRLDFLVGPGKALDTSRSFVIAVDAIGNGICTSPSNSTAQPGMRFPRFGIRDMVHAQHRLLTEVLGVESLQAIVGASMGGMQALQWGVSHPRFAAALVAMTPMARTDPWAVAVVETARACLMADPAWNGEGFTSRPERGWRAYAGLMNALAMRTPEAAIPFGQAVAQQEAAGFDATDYLYQSWAYAAHDVGATPGFDGDLQRALGSIAARTLVLAPPLDLFNPAPAARRAAEAIPGARFVEIPSAQGHLAASAQSAADAAFLNEAIGGFLRAC